MSTQPAKKTSAARTRAYRERLRAQGLKPRVVWALDVSDPAVREQLHRESLSLRDDPAEAEVIEWLEAMHAEDDPWS